MRANGRGVSALFLAACVILMVSGLAASGRVHSTLAAPKAPLKSATSSPAPLSAPSRLNRPKIAKEFGDLPLSFEPNVGQTDRSVRFISHGSGYTLFLTANAAQLSLDQPDEAVEALDKMDAHTRKRFESRRYYRMSPRFHRKRPPETIRVAMEGANASPVVTTSNELQGRANYFIGRDPKAWHTGIPTYGRVTYSRIYPGTDLIYYGRQGHLEFDFVLAPGADPKAIRLHFDAPGPLAITKDGALTVETGSGPLELLRPTIYQMDGKKRVLVEGRFFLEQDEKTAGIELASYDHSRLLVIDPALGYSTYLGGNGSDYDSGVAVDSQGDAYIAGQTTSSNFPTVNGYSSSGNANGVAFVSELNPTGTALLYSTYLGGTGGDWGAGMALDASGNVYVTGATLSTDFPLVNALQPSLLSTNGNAFVAQIATTQTGTASLLYSTYLGGGGNSSNSLGDVGLAVAVDASGLTYVTGQTASDSSVAAFPTTSTALQSSLASPNGNAFLTVLDTEQTGATSLVYSTYLGGSSVGFGDYGLGITADNNGNAYMTGQTTSSTGFPTTGSAYQAVLNSTEGNVFVTEIATTQSGSQALVYSTYLGGSSTSIGDVGAGVGLDATGKIYVGGDTTSSDFPVTSGAYQTTNSVAGKAFVAAFDPTQAGTQSLVYSTFLGGTNGGEGEVINALAADANGDAFVAGSTSSSDFPTTAGALQTVLKNPSWDAFLSELNPSGTNLSYSTYLGGSCSNGDLGNGVAIDWLDNAYLAGSTCSTDLTIYPSNAYQTSLGGVYNAFVAKVALSPNPGIVASESPQPNAAGWNNSAVTVSFTCIPGGAPLSSCTSPDTLTTEGANQSVTGTAVDAASNSATATAIVNIDLTAPTLSITTPSSSSVTVSTPYIAISGSVSDALSGVGGVTCNGAPATVASTSFSCTVPLSTVSNTVEVVGFDVAGNTTTTDLSVTVSMSTPTSLTVTPPTPNMTIGGTQAFTAVDQTGTPRPDATWSISDTTIASFESSNPNTLVGNAAGTATLTATIDRVTGTTTVTVLSGAPSVGTALWSAPAISGYSAQQIVQAVPTANGPDLYSLDEDSSGDFLVRAFKSDGEQLWQNSMLQSSTPGLSITAMVGDNQGGVLLLGVGLDSSSNQVSQITDVHPITGAQLWQASSLETSQFDTNIAVGFDGTVYAIEKDCVGAPTETNCLDAFDGSTGSAKSQAQLPVETYTLDTTACGGSVTSTQYPGLYTAPIVGPDGATYMQAESSQGTETHPGCAFNTAITATDSLTLLKNGAAFQTIASVSSTSYTGGFLTPGSTIPDGNGGMLSSFTETSSDYSTTTAMLSDSGGASTSLSSISPFAPPDNMVLGDNNTAFITDGSNVVSFNPSSLAQNWSYISTGGTLSLVAATSGSGVTVNDTSQGLIHVDSSGTPATPISGLAGASPMGLATPLAYFREPENGPWAGIADSLASVIEGPTQDAGSVWYLATGAMELQRVAATQATPTNFQLTAVTPDPQGFPTGTLQFDYRWASSSGRPQDLALCRVGEIVTYPGTADPFPWPSPMVSTRTLHNPTVGSGPAFGEHATDDNWAPNSYSEPYSAVTFAAQQELWWSCPYYKNGAVIGFGPDNVILRRVYVDTDSRYKYQESKSGYSGTVVVLP